MRRLPIFFVLDVSESMAGENLYKLEEGIGQIVSTLRRDPYALETAWLSVIAFAGRARTLLPLCELTAFHPPELPIGGGTALGAALDHLMDEIERRVVRSTPERKGDWKPIVFLLTDGCPTDDAAPAIARWTRGFRARANLIAVSIGGNADHAALKRLTDDVVVFNDAAPDAFARFVTWMSLSIQSQSRSVQAGDDAKVNLAKAEPGLVEPVDHAGGATGAAGIDDRYAVFVGKCAKNRLPYLVKFEQHLGRIETADPALARMFATRRYALSFAMPVKNSYFDLTDGTPSNQSVNSQDLIGQPQCPHCNAPYGMAVCGCGGIHCIGEGGEQLCPWCGNVGVYGAADEGGFAIGRGRG